MSFQILFVTEIWLKTGDKTQSCDCRGGNTLLRLHGDKYSLTVAGGKQQSCDRRGGNTVLRLHGDKYSLAVSRGPSS
jgi:hypothetical protein